MATKEKLHEIVLEVCGINLNDDDLQKLFDGLSELYAEISAQQNVERMGESLA